MTMALLISTLSACERPAPILPATLNAQGELALCGERYLIDTRISFLQGQRNQPVLQVSIPGLLGEPIPAVHPRLSVLLHCDTPNGIWERSGPQVQSWSAVIDRPELGLREHRAAPTHPAGPYVLVFSAMDDSYRKPDGSPFLLHCRASPQWQPSQCHVQYVQGRLHVNYIYRVDGHLARWRQIDTSLRRFFDHQES